MISSIFKSALVVSIFISTSLLSSARTFTSDDGRKISAEIVGYTETHVTLKTSKTRKTYVLPLEKLSTADQEYINKLRETEEEQMDKKNTEEEAKRKKAEVQASIVAYVESQKGKKVGNGECWTLANEAYKSAKAQRPSSRVWGRVVDWKKEPVLPGDILELESASFAGGSKTGPNHTAVIMKKGRSGKFVAYEQNIGGKKIVRESDYNLRDLKSGKVIVYRYE